MLPKTAAIVYPFRLVEYLPHAIGSEILTDTAPCCTILPCVSAAKTSRPHDAQRRTGALAGRIWWIGTSVPTVRTPCGWWRTSLTSPLTRAFCTSRSFWIETTTNRGLTALADWLAVSPWRTVIGHGICVGLSLSHRAAGIHMSDIPSFPYRILWEERELLSVANLTRQDGVDFLRLAPQVGVVTQTTRYPLQEANQALADLRNGKFEGATVLTPSRVVTAQGRRRAIPRRAAGLRRRRSH